MHLNFMMCDVLGCSVVSRDLPGQGEELVGFFFGFEGHGGFVEVGVGFVAEFVALAAVFVVGFFGFASP